MNAIAVKRELYQKVNQMPAELAKQLLDYANELESHYEYSTIPKSLTVKSKDDLVHSLNESYDDITAGRIYSIDEALSYIDSL